MARKNYEIDMTEGPILGKMIRFALPLMLSSILQLLFNAADVIVVGRFAGSEALAAVGSTGSLINLLINLFIGLSVGTNVIVARYLGAHDYDNCQESVHTSILLSVIGGSALIFIGLFFAKPLLTLMGSPKDVLPQASLYMQIYFVGMPMNMLYNFGSAIMRSTGDTKRPMFFLIISGIINVCLNLFMVIVLHMGVAGVAIATVVSQTVSAILTLIALMRTDGFCRVDLRKLKIHKDKLLAMIHVGLPAGLQGIVFSISNVLIQSSVNSFGSTVMAGNTAASNIEGFVYVAMNAMYQTALSFASQNLGAKKYDRLNKIMIQSVATVAVIGLVVGPLAYAFGRQLLGSYSESEEVIRYGLVRMRIIANTYFLCGIMDVMVGNLRGMGYSISPMIISLTGACGTRVIWILTVFAAYHDLNVLYSCYPLSWFLTAVAHVICYIIVKRKFDKKVKAEEAAEAKAKEDSKSVAANA